MTDYVRIIDPDSGSGTNHTSLAAWESWAQNQYSPVGSGDRVIAECRCTGGTADTSGSGCHVDGWTVNGEIIIYTTEDGGYRHKGVYPSSGNTYRIETNSSWMNPIRLNEPNCTVEGIAAKSTNATPQTAFNSTSGNTGGDHNGKFIANYAHGNTTARCFSITTNTAGDKMYFINNFAYKGDYGFALGGVSNSTQYIYNNVASNCTDDLFRTYSCKSYIYNNISQNRDGSGHHYDCYGDVYDDTNSSENSSYVSLIDVNRIDGAVTFWTASAGNLLLSASDGYVRGRGIPMHNDEHYPFSKDYSGKSRGSGSEFGWDLGPHQITDTAPALSASVIDPSNGAGTDFTSLSSWESANQRDLTPGSGDDTISVAYCRGGRDGYASTVLIDGCTTGTANRIQIRNHPDETPTGYWNEDRYWMHFATHSAYLNVDDRDVDVIGIQILNDTNAQGADAQYCLQFNNTTNSNQGSTHYVVNNILRVDETANGTKALYNYNVSYGIRSQFVVIGNMIITREDGLWWRINHSKYIIQPEVWVLNNTIIGDDKGITYHTSYRHFDERHWVRNNVIHINTADETFDPEETTSNYWEDDDDYNDYNYDNDAVTAHVARGSNGGYMSKANMSFEDATDSDSSKWDVRITKNSSLKGAGQNLIKDWSTLPDHFKQYLAYSINNVPRGTYWDVGAHQTQWTSYNMII